MLGWAYRRTINAEDGLPPGSGEQCLHRGRAVWQSLYGSARRAAGAARPHRGDRDGKCQVQVWLIMVINDG